MLNKITVLKRGRGDWLIYVPSTPQGNTAMKPVHIHGMGTETEI